MPLWHPTGNLTQRQFRKEQFKARYRGHIHGRGLAATSYREEPGLHHRRRKRQYNAAFVTSRCCSSLRTIQALRSAGSPQSSTEISIQIPSLDWISRAPNGADIQRNGLPVLLTKVSVDVNISSGVYTEGYSVGTIQIHYIPSGKHTPGVLSQGKAIVTIHAQIYAANTSFILRNAHINPGCIDCCRQRRLAAGDYPVRHCNRAASFWRCRKLAPRIRCD